MNSQVMDHNSGTTVSSDEAKLSKQPGLHDSTDSTLR